MSQYLLSKMSPGCIAGRGTVWQCAQVKQSALRDMISLVLAKKPGSTARYLSDVIGVNKSSVNAVLYKYPQRFVASDAATPRWSLVDGSATPGEVASR
jgi:hypothetical protein